MGRTPPARPGRPVVAAGRSAPTQADLLDFVRRTAADTELIASLPLDPEG
ncbi:cysteine dioxygenase, partial [Streptomyces sp. NPDC049099]